jgi:hypothetical protein
LRNLIPCFFQVGFSTFDRQRFCWITLEGKEKMFDEFDVLIVNQIASESHERTSSKKARASSPSYDTSERKKVKFNSDGNVH